MIDALTSLFRRRGCSLKYAPRNVDYPATAYLPRNARPQMMEWRSPWLGNQGASNKCVAFACNAEAQSLPVQFPGFDVDAAFDWMCRHDKFADRNGTSVNAGMKWLQRIGYCTEYCWANTVEELALAVSYLGPAVIGMKWPHGCARPRNGYMRMSGRSGNIGHCVLFNAVFPGMGSWLDDTFRVHNSYGRGWGINGTARISFQQMQIAFEMGAVAAIPLVRNEEE